MSIGLFPWPVYRKYEYDPMTAGAGGVWVRCGTPTATDRLVVVNSVDDPLQVSECAGCGAVVRIAGHGW